MDAALPQVFDTAKDREIRRRNMKKSSNSVLDLLAYSSVQLNEILDLSYKHQLSDINPSWW